MVRTRSATMSTPLHVILEDRGVVSVGGPEAGPFLQGLISNDIERATATRAVYAALLTPQGKFLHDFFVLRQGGEYLLDCEGPRTGDLGRRLMAYRLRAHVSLADATEDFRVVALIGGAEGEAPFDLPPGEGGAVPCAGGMLMRDPRGAALGLARPPAARRGPRLPGRGRFCPRRRRRLRAPPPQPTARPTAAATWRWAGRR